MENEELKKAPHIAGNEELQKLRLDNAGLKVRGQKEGKSSKGKREKERERESIKVREQTKKTMQV